MPFFEDGDHHLTDRVQDTIRFSEHVTPRRGKQVLGCYYFISVIFQMIDRGAALSVGNGPVNSFVPCVLYETPCVFCVLGFD